MRLNAHAAVHYINVCKAVPKQAFINQHITKCNVTVCVYRSFKVTTHFLSPCEVAKVKAQSYIKKALQHKHVYTSTHCDYWGFRCAFWFNSSSKVHKQLARVYSFGCAYVRFCTRFISPYRQKNPVPSDPPPPPSPCPFIPPHHEERGMQPLCSPPLELTSTTHQKHCVFFLIPNPISKCSGSLAPHDSTPLNYSTLSVFTPLVCFKSL